MAGRAPEQEQVVPSQIGVVDLGGSHVSVALVDALTRSVVEGSTVGAALDPGGAGDDLVATMAQTMKAVDGPEVAFWGLAVPGPFDYVTGVAQYSGVGKFDALRGRSLRVELGAQVLAGPGGLFFVNDADAFVLGEWATGAVAGVSRCFGLTLGSGIGSAFLHDGRVVDSGPTVPPEGSVHLLTWQGVPLEDVVSRRALRAAYSGLPYGGPDVAEIAQRARDGDERAREVFHGAFRTLGEVLAPWVRRFGATDVVVGGNVSRSWDVVAPPLLEGLGVEGVQLRLVPAAHLDRAAFVGAAVHALDRTSELEPRSSEGVGR